MKIIKTKCMWSMIYLFNKIRLWINVAIINYFMVRDEHSVHSVLIGFASLIIPFLSEFRSARCWSTWMGSLHHLITMLNLLIPQWIKRLPTITMEHQVAVLLRVIILVMLFPITFLFPQMLICFVSERHCPGIPYQEFGLTLPADSFILSGFCYPDLVLPLTSYLSPSHLLFSL